MRWKRAKSRQDHRTSPGRTGMNSGTARTPAVAPRASAGARIAGWLAVEGSLPARNGDGCAVHSMQPEALDYGRRPIGHCRTTDIQDYWRGLACLTPLPRPPHRGGAARRSTRSTCAASPTATATASATSPASAPACRTCATSASTRSGSTRGTCPRRRTPATTWPTTATSTRSSARSPTPRR